jgi:hypothetical protein
MQSTERGDPASAPDTAPPEKPTPQRDGSLPFWIGVGGLLTVAWFCVLVLLGWWLIRAVL